MKKKSKTSLNVHNCLIVEKEKTNVYLRKYNNRTLVNWIKMSERQWNNFFYVSRDFSSENRVSYFFFFVLKNC